MKNRFKLLYIVLFFASNCIYSQNLLPFGNFETGALAPNFNTNYYILGTLGSSNPRDYSIISNANAMNTANFSNAFDHTLGTTSGKIMVVDGSGNGGDKILEINNGSSLGIISGRTYIFSYWIRSISATNIASNSAIIAINTNGTTTTPVLILGPSMCPTGNPSAWTEVKYQWTATTSNAQIWLTDNQTSGGGAGNDFALDDISLTAVPIPLTLTYNFNNLSCSGTNNGSVIGYATGGTTPYTYSLMLGATVINNIAGNSSGIYSGLAAGSYSISVIDASGTTLSQNAILISAPNITVSPSQSICISDFPTLSVSGGTTYSWTASPTDTSLTNPANNSTSANPIVSPDVTTTYTVTSTVPSSASVNLIYNGGFSLGNVGFSSDYQYFATSNQSQKSYGIINNANSWLSNFSNLCIDHSTTGNMMVVDGSTFSYASSPFNDKVWGQTVPVNTNKTYTFSFWVQTLKATSPVNLAKIKVFINGTQIGVTNTAPTTECSWVQYTYTWNSLASSVASISIIDSNTNATENDFALDDISFKTTGVSSCAVSKDVIITVIPRKKPNVICGLSTPTSIGFSWNSLLGATSYSISYSVNGGAPIVPPATVLTNFTVTGTAGSSVEITVLPIGTGCFAPGSESCSIAPICPIPSASVTVQSTCLIPTGTIVFTSPTNPNLPTDLFISEVTDAESGSLTYVEIYNGTGVTKNLANYKLRFYNNGTTVNGACDFLLAGFLPTNSVYTVHVSSDPDLAGVIPDLVVTTCSAINIQDHIRLTNATNGNIDLWGESTGTVNFTPSGDKGYTYRRLQSAPHPSSTWNAANWTALDPEVYSNVGQYSYPISSYQYSVDGGANYQTSTIFSGLAPGTYDLLVKDVVLNCVSSPISLIINSTSLAAPTASATVQPTCSSLGTIVVSAPIGANYQYSNGGIYQSSPIFSNLAASTYSITVKNTVTGCISSVTSVVLTSVSTIAAPTLGTISQPTCLISTGSVVLNGLPSGNWTINPGAITGSTASTTLSGLTSGTTNYTVTNAAGCVSLASANVLINAQPSNPTAPIVGTISQPTCLISTGSVVLNGLPSGNWTINPGAITGSTASTTLSGLTSGTTNYTVTNAAGCVSSASTNVTINTPLTIPTAPIVGTISQPTCLISTGSVVLNGLPSGNWTINPGVITGSTASTTLSGLTSGTTNYTVTNAAGCVSPASANVLILLAPPAAAPIFTPISPICYGTIITLPLNSLNGVTGTWLPPFDPITTRTYTFTPDPGQCSSATTLQVTVLPNPTVNASPITETICSLQSTGIVLSGSIAGTTFSWVPSTTTVSGAFTDSGTIISQVLTETTTSVGTVIYSITPSYNGCSGTPISVSIFVTPKPILSLFPASQTICSGTSTSIELSSSMTNTNYNWNVIGTNVSGALAGTGPIISQILTVGNASGNAVYSIVPNVNGCPGNPIEVTINVNPIPTLTINPVLGQTICSGETTAIALSSSVSNTTFSWAAIQNNVNGSGPGNGNTIAQTLTTIPTTTVPILGTVTYTITPISNGCIGASGIVLVNVKPTPEIFGLPSQLPICSGESTNIVLTSSLIGTTFSWTVNPNRVSGARNDSGYSIVQALETLGNTSGTVVYTVTPMLNLCSGLPLDIPIKVNPLPLPTLTPGVICVDASGIAFQTYILDTGLSNTDYTFEWSINGVIQSEVGTTFEALIAGNYSVIATNILTGCISIPVFSVVSPSFPATGLTAEVTSLYFSENGTITATVTGGNGTYLFALDNGALQTSNVFENVDPGQHTVSVTDTNGCTNLLPVTLNTIGYPTYFTPNGDGIHDTWNIIGLENQPTAKVYVFDRYGKLIKQISTRSSGWDGTYNGNLLPASDYWFTIDYLEPGAKIFKSHFSLKR